MFRFSSRLFLFSFFLISADATISQAQSSITKLDRATLRVFVREDLKGERSETHYQVESRGKLTALRFSKGAKLDGLRTGMKVNVRGKKDKSGALVVGSDEGSFKVVQSAVTAGIGGVRQAIVLRIQSASAVSPATHEQLANVMRGADAGFQESSYGMLSVKNDLNSDGTPDVYTVSITQSSAGVGESSAFSFCTAAQSALSSKFGINASSYNHTVCILPPDMSYSWYGQAYIGGRELVINGNYATGMADGMEHEIAHNLGMHHANTPTAEYGEGSAVMGGHAGGGSRDFNAPHKSQMAWVSAAVAGAGSFELNAVELQPSQRVSGNTLLKVRDAVAARDLFISYRAPLGNLGQGLREPYKTSIHTWPGGSSKTILLASLGDGQSFSQNGITISQTGHTAVSGSVTIGAECAAAAPAVTLTPATFLTGSLQQAGYNVTVQNKDINCTGNTTFTLSAAAPAGFSSSFSSETLSIAPGQSASTSFIVTPSSGLASSNYNIPLAVAAAGHASGNGAVQYVFDTTAPSAPSNLSASVRKGKVTLSYSAGSDSLSGIASYRVFRNGVEVGSSTTTSFSETPGSGTFQYAVVAVDKAGNRSGLSSAITVSTSTSGGGKPRR